MLSEIIQRQILCYHFYVESKKIGYDKTDIEKENKLVVTSEEREGGGAK